MASVGAALVASVASGIVASGNAALVAPLVPSVEPSTSEYVGDGTVVPKVEA